MRWHTDGRQHFVYRVFAADGELLYVGLTVNPEGRITHHRCTALWFPLVDHIDWEDAGRVRSLAEVRELAVIRSEQPRHNRLLNNHAAEAAAFAPCPEQGVA